MSTDNVSRRDEHLGLGGPRPEPTPRPNREPRQHPPAPAGLSGSYGDSRTVRVFDARSAFEQSHGNPSSRQRLERGEGIDGKTDRVAPGGIHQIPATPRSPARRRSPDGHAGENAAPVRRAGRGTSRAQGRARRADEDRLPRGPQRQRGDTTAVVRDPIFDGAADLAIGKASAAVELGRPLKPSERRQVRREVLGQQAGQHAAGQSQRRTPTIDKYLERLSERQREESQTAKAAAAQQVRATNEAAKSCWTERKADPAAFKTKYGTNANKSNAFGKCVSGKVKHSGP
jgi:hypothetical protein